MGAMSNEKDLDLKHEEQIHSAHEVLETFEDNTSASATNNTVHNEVPVDTQDDTTHPSSPSEQPLQGTEEIVAVSSSTKPTLHIDVSDTADTLTNIAAAAATTTTAPPMSNVAQLESSAANMPSSIPSDNNGELIAINKHLQSIQEVCDSDLPTDDSYQSTSELKMRDSVENLKQHLEELKRMY